MKDLECGGKLYRVNDEAECKNGKIANATSKTLISSTSKSSLSEQIGYKGRKAAGSAEKSLIETYAEKGMRILGLGD